MQIFHWFNFPRHCTLGSMSIFKHGYAKNIYASPPPLIECQKNCQNRLTHLYQEQIRGAEGAMAL